MDINLIKESLWGMPLYDLFTLSIIDDFVLFLRLWPVWGGLFMAVILLLIMLQIKINHKNN